MRVPSAYLRVYVPASELESADTDALKRSPSADARRWRELSGGDLGLLVESRPIPGWRMEGPDGTLLCPARVRLRTLAGLLSIRDQFPTPLGEQLVSDELMGDAAEELRGLRFKGELKTYVLQSPWHVPLRWFLAFDASERNVATADDMEHPSNPLTKPITVTYEAALGDACDRVQRAAEVAREAGLADEVVNLVEDLAGWLDDFPRVGSRVVLDYGDLARLFDPADLAVDNSAEQMHGAVDALERGDWDESARLYFAVNERWMALRAFENAS